MWKKQQEIANLVVSGRIFRRRLVRTRNKRQVEWYVYSDRKHSSEFHGRAKCKPHFLAAAPSQK